MIKKRRYLISAAILAACVCLAIGVLVMMQARPGVTKANFDRIEEGMTKADVEAILGKPVDSLAWNHLIWQSADGTSIEIEFVRNRVRLAEFQESRETVIDKLRRWLRLPK